MDELLKVDHRGAIVMHIVHYTFGGGKTTEDDFDPMTAQYYCGAQEELTGSGRLFEGTYLRQDANCQDCIRKWYALQREDALAESRLTEASRGEKT